ncbi:hypothetical protein HAX54_038467 [Datura stramonium]|uniref:Uncharacterized protein n=1 Tax=Datura stramonium TaxID=4076 RepID=A0ABS8VMU7_DATST|nr:hypothetical protein [Datura stramonium]
MEASDQDKVKNSLLSYLGESEGYYLSTMQLSNYNTRLFKPCLLYMGMFPDERIPVSKLISLWIASEETNFNLPIGRSERGFSEELSKFASLGSNTRKPFHQHLRSLIMTNGSGFPARILFNKCSKLRLLKSAQLQVLRLSGKKFSVVSELHLPSSLKKLVLRWMPIESAISFIGELPRLEYLQLWDFTQSEEWCLPIDITFHKLSLETGEGLVRKSKAVVSQACACNHNNDSDEDDVLSEPRYLLCLIVLVELEMKKIFLGELMASKFSQSRTFKDKKLPKSLYYLRKLLVYLRNEKLKNFPTDVTARNIDVAIEFLLFLLGDVPNHVINGNSLNEVLEKIGVLVGNILCLIQMLLVGSTVKEDTRKIELGTIQILEAQVEEVYKSLQYSPSNEFPIVGGLSFIDSLQSGMRC